MIAKKSLTLLGLAAVTLAAVPSIGLAGSHYSGKVPPSLSSMQVAAVTPVKKTKMVAATKAAAKKTTIKSKHKKHKKHKKLAVKK